MVFTNVDKIFDERVVVDITYSVAKSIVIRLKDRLKTKKIKYHFINVLGDVENAQIWAHFHKENETSAIYAAVDAYITWYLSYRKL